MISIMVVYECDKCYKSFTLKGDYDKHKNRKKPCDAVNNNKFLEITQKMEELCEDNKKLNKMSKKLNESNKELKKKIRKMEKQMDNNHNITNEINAEINNGDNIVNNVNNNVNNNINLISYGKEDTSFLTEKKISKILLGGLKCIGKYVEEVHCNPEKPEYKNIYISNKKNMDDHLFVYEGMLWKLTDCSYIDVLRDRGIDFIEEKYEDLKNRDDIPKGIIKMAERFLEHMQNDTDGSKKEKISKDLKIILYNNRPRKP